MAIIQSTTNVVLPEWLLTQRSTLPERDFRFEVLKYLQRYKNYHFQEVQGGYAICIREDAIETERRKKNGKTSTR
jgi:hypothetical protein